MKCVWCFLLGMCLFPGNIQSQDKEASKETSAEAVYNAKESIIKEESKDMASSVKTPKGSSKDGSVTLQKKSRTQMKKSKDKTLGKAAGKDSEKTSRIKADQKDPKPQKTPKASGKEMGKKAQQEAKFQVEVHQHQTSLPHPFWYIPSDKQIVSMVITFKHCGLKNTNGTHPALGSFLGLVTKGCGSFNDRQFAQKLHDLGANINLFAGQDDSSLSFWAPVISYKEALDMAALMCLSPKLPHKAMEKMRLHIGSSFREGLKDPSTHLTEAANAAFYPEGHPYRVSLKAEEEDIKKIRAKDIQGFLSVLDQNSAQVVVLGPREKEEEICLAIEKMLLKFPVRGKDKVLDVKKWETLTPQKDVFVPFDIPQTMIIGRQAGLETSDPNYYAKNLALCIAGRGSLESILYRRVREDHGLAYYCLGENVITDGGAFFKVRAGTRNETAEQTRKIIRDVLRDLTQHGVSKKDFEIGKKVLVGSLIVSLDRSAKFVSYFANGRALGWSLDQIQNAVDSYEKVTHAMVNQACKDFFRPSELVFVSIGQEVKKEPTAESKKK